MGEWGGVIWLVWHLIKKPVKGDVKIIVYH